MLKQLTELANEKYDGHFTILKFTTNYRVCFGTVIDPAIDTSFMAEGKTLDEAIAIAIEKDINCYEVHKRQKKRGNKIFIK